MHCVVYVYKPHLLLLNFSLLIGDNKNKTTKLSFHLSFKLLDRK